MSKIQLVLMAGVLGLGALGSMAFGARLTYRLALLGLGGVGIFFIAFPDRTTDIAHMLGVGRGTDLLLYLGIVTGGFALLLRDARIRRLERKLTEFVRASALQDGRGPEERP